VETTWRSSESSNWIYRGKPIMKTWRIYEIIDEETGEMMNSKKYDKKNYITIKTEKTIKDEQNYKIETTRRIVRHNGQQKLF
jgi:hypothetical protein